MEISNETKAKVFAQYLGQQVQTPTRRTQGEGKPFKILKGTLKEIDLGMANNSIGILLEDEADFSNHTNYTPNDCKLILRPLSEITDEEAKMVMEIGGCVNISSVKLSDTGNGIWVYWDGTNKFSFFYDFVSAQVDYLRSIGIDWPHYLLGNETLHAAGLAIYQPPKAEK